MPQGQQRTHVDNITNFTDSIRIRSLRKQTPLDLARRQHLGPALDGWLGVLGVLARLGLGLQVFCEREVPGLSGVRRAADVVDHLWRLVEDQQRFWAEGLALCDLGLVRREESVVVGRQFPLSWRGR